MIDMRPRRKRRQKQRRPSISVSKATGEAVFAYAAIHQQTATGFVERLILDTLSLPADELAVFIDRCRAGRDAAVARSAKVANRTYVDVPQSLFDRIKLIAKTEAAAGRATTKPNVLDTAINVALDAAEAEQRCQWYVDCDQRSTHVVREPAEYDEDGRDVIESARDRRLCGRHARAYDKQHAVVRKTQPIAKTDEGVAA